MSNSITTADIMTVQKQLTQVRGKDSDFNHTYYLDLTYRSRPHYNFNKQAKRILFAQPTNHFLSFKEHLITLSFQHILAYNSHAHTHTQIHTNTKPHKDRAYKHKFKQGYMYTHELSLSLSLSLSHTHTQTHTHTPPSNNFSLHFLFWSRAIKRQYLVRYQKTKQKKKKKKSAHT